MGLRGRLSLQSYLNRFNRQCILLVSIVFAPRLLLPGDRRTATRTIRNTGDRALYFSSATSGFATAVRVRPLAVRLGPGEETAFTVSRPPGPPRGRPPRSR